MFFIEEILNNFKWQTLYLNINPLKMRFLSLLIIIKFTICRTIVGQENPNNLPYEIYISSPQNIEFDKKNSCTVKIFQNNQLFSFTGKIKRRGGYTVRYPKASFSLHLNDKIKIGNLKGDKDFMLISSYIDKTFMRNRLSYDLFRLMDKKNTSPKIEYVKLKINDVDHGIFLLTEKLDASTLKIKKEDELAFIFKEPLFLLKDRITSLQDTNNYHQQEYPNKSKRDLSYIMDSLNHILFHSDDKTFVTAINQWFDLNNLADWYIILKLSNNSDGVMKNFFIYRVDHKSKYRITLWDYDHSFGRDGDNERNMMERELNLEKSILFKRLLMTEKSNFRKILKKRWDKLRKNIINEKTIFDKMSQYEKQLNPMLESNFMIWPANDKNYYDGNGFEAEIKLIKEFIAMRLPYCDNYFNKL